MEKLRIKAEIVSKMVDYPDMAKIIGITLGCSERTAAKYLDDNSVILTCYSVVQMIKTKLRIPENQIFEAEFPAPIKIKSIK